jgi:hypothetical protein
MKSKLDTSSEAEASNTSDGILTLSNFSVVRLAKQTYMREVALLITDVCIKKDS